MGNTPGLFCRSMTDPSQGTSGKRADQRVRRAGLVRLQRRVSGVAGRAPTVDGHPRKAPDENALAGGPALCLAAAGPSGAGATPLVALPCAGFQNAEQLLELG